MKKLFFSAVAVMVMVSVSNTFASKSAMNMNMAAPEDTTVSAPADTTVSAPVDAPAEMRNRQPMHPPQQSRKTLPHRNRTIPPT